MKPANYAPVYAGLYPDLAEIARKHGYAMAIHGSLASDMDLICIPWVGGAAEPQAVVNEILETYAIRRADGNPKIREHGRMVYTLVIAAPRAFVDLSFMPMGRPDPSASREVTVTDEMVLAGCRILHPSLFSRGLEPRPGDGPSTRGIIAEDIKKVRGILTAALAALPEREG